MRIIRQTDQRQFLQQHVHHGSLFVLLEGLSLLAHLLCLGTTLGLHSESLGIALHLKRGPNMRFELGNKLEIFTTGEIAAN